MGMPSIVGTRAGAQGHDGPFAELLFDLGHRRFQRGMGVEHGIDFGFSVFARRRFDDRARLDCWFFCHGLFSL